MDGNQLRELRTLREKLSSLGFLDVSSQNSVLLKYQNGNESLGGVGRKRPNTGTVEQLESQI